MTAANPLDSLFPDLDLPVDDPEGLPEPWLPDAADDTEADFVPLFPAAPERPPNAGISAMLAAARDQAFCAGAAAGREAELKSREALVAANLSRIADALADGRRAADELAEEVAAEMAKLVADSLALALPTLAERITSQDALAFAASLVPALTAEPRIDIRVAPSLAPGLAERMSSYPALHLAADPHLPEGDVRITWRDGQAEHRSVAFRSAMLGMVASLLASVGGQHVTPTGTER